MGDNKNYCRTLINKWKINFVTIKYCKTNINVKIVSENAMGAKINWPK